MSTKWPTGYMWRVPPDLGAHTPMYGPADFQIMCELTRPIYAPPPLDNDEVPAADAQYTVPKTKAMTMPLQGSSSSARASGFNRPPATMKGKGVVVPPPPPPAVIPPARQPPKGTAGHVIGAPMKTTNKAAAGPVPPRGPPPHDSWASDPSHDAAVGGASRFLLSVQHTCKWCTAIYC